jgi:DNA-binding PadR family transcriptional regulator
MDLSAPFQTLFPTVDSAVLSVLSESTKPRTGREIAKVADRSQDATQRVLDRLVEHGLVLKTEAGRARLYTLNHRHLAARPVTELANLRGGLFEHLREDFGFWDPFPLHASIFGSVARGDGGLDSDVDIFLVRSGDIEEDDEKWRTQIEMLAESVYSMTGNHAGIAEVSEEDLERLRRDRPAVVESLRTDAVNLAGIPIRKLLRRM